MKYCEEYAALLDQYVDGELPVDETAQVRRHLESCPGCMTYVDGALAIRAAFPDAEGTEVPEGFAEGVMAAVRSLEVPREAKKKRAGAHWKKLLLPLAACFAIVLALRWGPLQGGGFDSREARADTPADAADTSAANGDAEYGLAGAAPEGGVQPRVRGAEAAPDDPAALCAAAPELQDGGEILATEPYGLPAAAAPRAILLTAAQAGELLEGLSHTVGEAGARCYQLPAGEFDLLLDTLAEQGVTPEQREPGPEAEALPAGYDLVYVAEE